jgi:hypothetical protein
MALMAARGEIGPMPDYALFADTGWEPRKVYDWLDWLETQLPFPVRRISGGNILDHIVRNTNKTGQRFASVPWFTENGGMGRRQCTREFKVDPLMKAQRALLGYPPRVRIPEGSCEVWIGISMDEMQRMKDARNKWQRNRWPLIEMGMSRRDCLKWMAERQYPTPPKSACIGCPYHSDAMWRDMRDNDPESWESAVEADKILRAGGTNQKMKHAQFMHRSLIPLAEVDLSTSAERGQVEFGFLQECDGMCGV